MSKLNKSGFTLVELSIVLVIIGLLIGGILIGQSLIESARHQNNVRELTQWSIAIDNFERKFKQYPGDSEYFEPKGNNNGYNNNFIGACPATAVWEDHSAWSHLTQAQMLRGEEYVWSSTNYCAGNSYKGMAPVPDFESYNGDNMAASISAIRSGFNYAGKRYEYTISNYYKFYDLLALEKKLNSSSDGTAGDKPCNIAGAEAEVAEIAQISSVEDVICRQVFFFSGGIPIGSN